MNRSAAGKVQLIQSITDPYQRLKKLIQILRQPGGCQWDQGQNFSSIKQDLLEEAHEVVAAVESGDFANLQEELGDLAFLFTFYCQMAEEQNLFTADDALMAVVEKQLYRHPHVFADTKVNGQADILKNWESLKDKEKKSKGEAALFGEKTSHLPALIQAEKIQGKASRKGFDWRKGDFESLLQILRGEIDELDEAVKQSQTDVIAGTGASERNQSEIEEEIGDVIFSIVNLCRHLNVSAEVALHRSTSKFIDRFRKMEALAASNDTLLAGNNPFAMPASADAGQRADAFEALYQQAKKTGKS